MGYTVTAQIDVAVGDWTGSRQVPAFGIPDGLPVQNAEQAARWGLSVLTTMLVTGGDVTAIHLCAVEDDGPGTAFLDKVL